MNGLISRGLAVLCLAGGVGVFGGCQCYRSLVDPCYPERYSAVARNSTVDTFGNQVGNGHVLTQTVWNYQFEAGTDKLTIGGLEYLGSLSRARPSPDPRLFLQTAHDIAYDQAAPEKYERARFELDAKRKVAVLRFLAAETAGRPVPFVIDVHDATPPDLAGTPVGNAVRQWYGNFQGALTGGTVTSSTLSTTATSSTSSSSTTTSDTGTSGSPPGGR